MLLSSTTWKVVFHSIKIITILIYHLQLQEEELSDAYLLVFANKQDLPNALTVSELTDRLGLHNIKSRQVRNARFEQQLPSLNVFVGFVPS